MLQPRGKGIVLWTLRYGDEVRDPEAYFAGTGDLKPDADLMKLTKKLIGKRTVRWDPEMVCRSGGGEAKGHHCREEKKGRKPPGKAGARRKRRRPTMSSASWRHCERASRPKRKSHPKKR